MYIGLKTDDIYFKFADKQKENHPYWIAPPPLFTRFSSFIDPAHMQSMDSLKELPQLLESNFNICF